MVCFRLTVEAPTLINQKMPHQPNFIGLMGHPILVCRCFMLTPVNVNEFVIFLCKCKRYSTSWTVPLFRDNNFNHIFIFCFFIVIIFTIKERNDVGILLNTSGLPEGRTSLDACPDVAQRHVIAVKVR